MPLFCLHFYKTVLLDERFLVDRIFVFQHFEHVTHCLDLHWCWWEAPDSHGALTWQVVLLTLLFSLFLRCRSCGFLCIFPNWSSLSFFHVYQISINFGSLSNYFLVYSPGAPLMYMLVCLQVSHLFQRFYSFIFYFSLFLGLHNVY